jgi:ATP-dependent DNA helicase RecG
MHVCRFGVEQRAKLAAKASPSPHVLYMTATPIPRTLALCEHGDLALYTIDELPPGRQPITTRVVTDTPKQRAQVSWRPLAGASLMQSMFVHISAPMVS